MGIAASPTDTHGKADPARVRAALALLEELPIPVLWIRHDRHVHWANAAARRHGGDVASAPCHQLCHGYDQPCALHGQGCPMDMAERTGRPVSALHAVPETPGDLFRIFAVPLSAGGVLEFHIPVHDSFNRDPVTSWLVRRAFEQVAAGALARYARAGESAAVFVVALTGLERICAVGGHEAVDGLRQRAARAIERYLATDRVAGHRLGHEFIVVQPCRDRSQAREVLVDLHRTVVGLRAEVVTLDRRAGVHAGLWCGAPDVGLDRALSTAFQDCFADLGRAFQKAEARRG